MDLRLTGDPVPPTFILERFQNTAEILYGPEVETSIPPMAPMRPYEKKEVTAALLQTDGSQTQIPLTVTSELLPNPKEAFLLFSDHPEILKQNGLLFSAGVIFLRPVRLNYYHENGPEEPPRAFVIRLDNTSEQEAIVHVLDACAGPGKDEVSIGHQASLMFLTRWLHHQGYIVTVPPKNHLILSRQIAKKGELVTGFLEVTELVGHPLQISVLAEDPKASEPDAFQLESKDTHVRGAYEMPHLYLEASYRAGDDPTILPLGDLPLKSLLPGQPLKGAYGMLWEGNIRLINPYNSIETIPLYFQPRGGAASGTFILDDFFKEVGPTQAYQKVLLFKFTLPPHSKKMVHFITMPEGGSSYPIRLILGQSDTF